jgi:hypothetical protein
VKKLLIKAGHKHKQYSYSHYKKGSVALVEGKVKTNLEFDYFLYFSWSPKMELGIFKAISETKQLISK